MIPKINGFIVECRIENWVAELNERVEFVEEQTEDRLVTVDILEKRLTLLTEKSYLLETENKLLLEEVNKLSKKNEQFSKHLNLVMTTLVNFQETVNKKFASIDQEIFEMTLGFKNLKLN